MLVFIIKVLNIYRLENVVFGIIWFFILDVVDVGVYIIYLFRLKFKFMEVNRVMFIDFFKFVNIINNYDWNCSK